MAESPAQERTLPATPYKLRKARERGQVLRSKELASTAVLLGAAGLFLLAGEHLYQAARSMMAGGLTLAPVEIYNAESMLEAVKQIYLTAAQMLFPLFAVVVFAGILGGVAIGGWSFSGVPLKADFSRINPGEGIKKMVSMQGAGELVKTIIKLAVVAGAATVALWLERGKVFSLLADAPRAALLQTGILFAHFFLYMAAATVLVLAFDVPFQIRQYAKQLRMTTQEVKEEMKETEGHPEVRRRIRQLQQERARVRMMAQVPRADVVITNPTHYAVALRYEPTRRLAPIVVAKGANRIAEHIRKLAREHHIPVLEAPGLARVLYRHVDLEAEVPGTLYQAVAQVLAYVYQLKMGADPGPLGEIGVPNDLQRGVV